MDGSSFVMMPAHYIHIPVPERVGSVQFDHTSELGKVLSYLFVDLVAVPVQYRHEKVRMLDVVSCQKAEGSCNRGKYD